MRFVLPARRIPRIVSRTIPITAVLLTGGLVVGGTTASATPEFSGSLGTSGQGVITPGTLTDAPGAVSPDSSGDLLPQTMPTGPVTPGAKPGTLVATTPDGQKIPCSTPANPYAGATKTPVFIRPGVTIRRYTKSGRTPLYVTTANLDNSGSKVRPAPLMYGHVSSLSTLRAKAGSAHAYVATNGDFFWLGQSGSPYGVEVTRGATVQKGTDRKQASLVLQKNRTATVASVWLSIAIKTNKGTVHGQSWNSQYLPRDGIAVFTPAWGIASRRYLRPAQQMREFVVSGHKVVAVNTHISAQSIPKNGYLIEAQGRAVNRLRAIGLKKGAAVAAGKFLHDNAPHGVDTAIGVGMALVHDKRYQGPVCSKDSAVARTIVGIMPGGKRMFIAVAQGQTDSAHGNFTGLTARESTALAYSMGASEAVMFDGGGSAAVVSRGSYGKVTQYTKSADGWDRYIPNGYGFWAR
jgi:phosphodiester glycosidase